MKQFKIWTVFDLMKYYIEEGRITVDPTKHDMPMTVHDPCNYVRKSYMMFGEEYSEKSRWIAKKCAPDHRKMAPTKMNNYCCGAGGGAWAMPYNEERIYYGRKKAEQIKATEAELVVAPCHNCRDQIMKGLTKEYNLGIETMYLWELVAESLVVEPWSEEEIEAAHALRDAQYEKFGIDLDEEMY